MPNIITSVRGRGITLAIKKEIRRKRVTKELALEGSKKFRPRLVGNVRRHYKNALSEIRRHTTEKLVSSVTTSGRKFVRLKTPELQSAVVRTPFWQRLNPEYIRFKRDTPGAYVFWKQYGDLARSLSSALSVSFGAKLENSVFKGVRKGAVHVFGLVEYQIRLQPVDPLIDVLVRKSFITGEAQPMSRFELFDPFSEGNDLRKVAFMERRGFKRPGLHRPIMGHMAAAYGQLMAKRLKKL